MIGKRLKLLRELKKKTQTEVCSALNIEQSTLANYENDKRMPKIDILIKLAEFYDVSVDFILGLEKSGNNELSNFTIDNSELELSEREQRLLDTFRQLNEDNQDIIIGETKKCLKEQRLEAAASGKYQKEA